MKSIPKTKKNIPKSVHEMSKEMLQETLRKKKECNTKALQIVENLCEAKIDENWFLANLQFINQCHFEDVVVERAISKLCGYPLCEQRLSKVPTQQYHISTKYNKVFDITERKNFCSSFCYKSATYIKKQLFTSPLWFRDQETIPEYKIMKPVKASLGKEVNSFSGNNKEEVKCTESKAVPIKLVNLDENIKTLENKCSALTIDDPQRVLLNKFENEKFYDKENTENNLNKKINFVLQECRQKTDFHNIKAVDNSSTKNVSLESSKTTEPNKPDSTKMERNVKNEPVGIIQKIENCIFEWFSLETLFYLYKEEKLKELLCDKTAKIKEILNSKLSMARHSETIDKMIQLYGLLDTNKFNSDGNKINLKPLPDYSALKEEGKSLEIKVRAFYQGQLEMKPAEENKEHKQSSKTPDSDPIYLPLIDAHSQVSLRRKIVLDKLNRVLPELIKSFSSDYILQMQEVRNLIATFTLASHNITFKPREWYLIGTIIIKMLCLKNKHLEAIVKLEPAVNQILLILASYELSKDYLDNLLLRLTDSTNFMKKLNEIND